MSITIGRRFVLAITAGHLFVRVGKREAFIDFTAKLDRASTDPNGWRLGSPIVATLVYL